MYHVIARKNGTYKQVSDEPVNIEQARAIKSSHHGDDPKIVNAIAVDEAIEKNNEWEKAIEKGKK